MKPNLKKINEINPIISNLLQAAFNTILILLYVYLISGLEFVTQIMISSILLLLLTIFIFLIFKPQSNFFIKSYYPFDFITLSLCISFLISSILSIPVCGIIKNGSWLYFYLLIALFGFSLIVVIARFIIVSFKKEHFGYSIVDAYQNNLPSQLSEFRIDEEAVNVDLLNRNNIVKKIQNAIFNHIGSKSQLISITGKWGCGKTTVLNLALNEKEKFKDFIFCKFDPWNYEDYRSTFVGLYKNIISTLNLGNVNESIINGIENLANEFLEDNKFGFLSNLLFLNSKTISVKRVIDSYLINNEKRLVIIIDNMDRVTYEKFVFLINTIEDLCKLHNITFVCLYDNKVAEDYLEKAYLGKNYLDKIVNIEIKIDNPSDTDIIDIGNKILNNIFAKYLPEEKLFSDSYSSSGLTKLLGSINNLRELVKILNDFIVTYDDMKKIVNPIDYLTVIYLKIYFPKLYELIRNNAKFFVATDSAYLDAKSFPDLTNEFNKIKESFFETNFSEGKEFYSQRELVSALFPHALEKYYAPSKSDEKKYNVERRAASGKHFASYFSEKHLSFGELNSTIENLFSLQLKGDIYYKYNLLFVDYRRDQHPYLLENIESCLHLMEIEKIEFHIDYFISTYKYFDNESAMFSLSAKSRCAILISELLLKINLDKSTKIIKRLENEVSNIVLLEDVKYWVNSKFERENNGNAAKLVDIINNSIILIRNIIYNNNVYIYTKKNYVRGITWRLIGGKEDITQYRMHLKNILKGDYIYVFLADLISISYSSKVSLSINKNTLNELNVNDIIEEQLNLNPPHNQKTQTIEKLYRLSFYQKSNYNFDDETNSLSFKKIPDWVYDYYGTNLNYFYKALENCRRKMDKIN